MNTLYLCGAGNSEGVRLARRVIEAGTRFARLVLLDDDPQKHGDTLLGAHIEGPIDRLAQVAPGAAAANLVARRTAGRAAVHRRIVASGVPLASLLHPGVDATDCDVGEGVIVYEQAILSPETRLGDGACVLMRGIVGHGAVVGAGCVIAPGAVLNARVRLGSRVYIGCNASVLPDVSIGDDATIGANTMVASDVPAGATVVGVPGQVLAPVPAEVLAGGVSALVPAAAPSVPGLPVSELEAQLLEVLHGVLGHRRAGPCDNFFDVGGNSLRALQFVGAVRVTLGRELPLPQFYANNTMRRLAEHFSGGTADRLARSVQARATLRRSLFGRSS